MPARWPRQDFRSSQKSILVVRVVYPCCVRNSRLSLTHHLSRVPKELISRFVKLCPTCQARRGTTRNSPPESEKSPEYMDTNSPDTMSPQSRRESVVTKRGSINLQSPLQLSGFSATFQQQNRWMMPLHPPQTATYKTDGSDESGSPTMTHASSQGSVSANHNFGNSHSNDFTNSMSFASGNPTSSSDYSASYLGGLSGHSYRVKQEHHY